MKIAAMDLGTNTFRLLISDNNGGKLNKLYRETNITRLGDRVKESSVINEDAIERSVEILKKYKSLSDSYSVNRIIAAGTSAFRNASNSDNLVKILKDQAGVEVRVISGEEEAELTVKGVLGSLESGPGRFYHLDIGGGSTEISLINKGKIEQSCSLELGVVSLAEMLVKNDNNNEALKEYVSEIIEKNVTKGDIITKLPLVATSGTPIVVACILNSVKKFDASSVNGMKLEIEEIEKVKYQLIKDSDINNLSKYGDILKGREDLIIPGTVILTQTMKYLSNDSMIISESGLLEGLSIEAA